MKLLAVDTSTKVAGAALMEDGLLVCETNLVIGLTHSERLLPIVDGCMRLAGWRPEDIDIFTAVAGPGSFTGIRIGVSTIKGMAEAYGKPVVAVNTLEALAALFPGFPGLIVPVLDARREQVYCAAYQGDLTPVLAPEARALADLLSHPAVAGAGELMFAGDGVPVYHNAITAALGARAVFAPAHLALQRAGATAWLAWRKAALGDTVGVEELLPEYLRKSSAEQVLERKRAEEATHEG